jgi:hypothetical protein
MADELERLFGKRPAGAWLAERVWEPSLVYDLAAGGYRWTVLDDNHLRAASIKEDEMWTAFTTDDRGRRLTVFGTEQGLRYRIPFRPVEEVIDYLRTRVTEDGRFVGMMGDDGEKFGSWPGTFEYCWSHEYWVDRMFEALERNSDWLATVTPSEWLARRPPTQRVYFPDSSYVEMTEWVLPADETPVFVDLLETARERGDPAARFLRGGFWRNFAAKYREINDLHKQMLRVSEKVDAMAPGPLRDRALDHLYQGQSNDCYWHGLFGGVYIVHMRMATLGHLIAAEDLADQAAADASGEPYGARLFDTDLDAIDEAMLTAPGQTVVIDPAEGANIGSWDLRASRVALASVMRRRPEAYHARLREFEQGGHEAGAADARAAASGGPKTIHDIVSVKEPGLSSILRYDSYERRSGVVHLLPADGSTRAEDFVSATYEELGDFVDQPFELQRHDREVVATLRIGAVLDGKERRPLAVQKIFRFGGDRMAPTLELEVDFGHMVEGDTKAVDFELAVEFNLNLMGGGHNPAAWYETEDGTRSPHDVAGEVASANRVAFGNDYEGVHIEATVDRPARLTWYPVETVSNSEAGFERVYQGSCLLFRWPVSLAPEVDAVSRTVRFEVKQSTDHSAREAR